jgi:hypothetical protein
VEIVEPDIGARIVAATVKQHDVLTFVVQRFSERLRPRLDPAGGMAEAGGEDGYSHEREDRGRGTSRQGPSSLRYAAAGAKVRSEEKRNKHGCTRWKG